MNQTQIQAQAKKILDSFAKSLDKIKIKPKKQKLPAGGFREESTPSEPNKKFKTQIFKNAPETQSDFLIAEKKKW